LYLRALIGRETAYYPVRIVDEIVDPWYPIHGIILWGLYVSREDPMKCRQRPDFSCGKMGSFVVGTKFMSHRKAQQHAEGSCQKTRNGSGEKGMEDVVD
jgi:hypothetical protein